VVRFREGGVAVDLSSGPMRRKRPALCGIVSLDHVYPRFGQSVCELVEELRSLRDSEFVSYNESFGSWTFKACFV
jgi:hypothetical protein